jgi:uncharacterized protein (DUF1697 family)
MPRYIAFLHAINVGGRVVKMARLRDLFESMGLTNVETFIASGNVIFDSTARNGATIERLVEGRLRAALGYDVNTFVRTRREVADAAAYQPFADMREIHTLSVGFMAQEPSPESRAAVTAFRPRAVLAVPSAHQREQGDRPSAREGGRHAIHHAEHHHGAKAGREVRGVLTDHDSGVGAFSNEPRIRVVLGIEQPHLLPRHSRDHLGQEPLQAADSDQGHFGHVGLGLRRAAFEQIHHRGRGDRAAQVSQCVH